LRKLLVEVVTPEEVVYTSEVDMVIAPGSDGEVGILPLHAPFITTLDIGELRLKIGQEQEYVAVHGGYLEVMEDKVIVLADAAELASQIDIERARKAKEKAEALLAKAEAGEGDLEQAQQALARALLRLRVAERRSS
jgi:F-type H+-transporting ATPase subunit epsilon